MKRGKINERILYFRVNQKGNSIFFIKLSYRDVDHVFGLQLEVFYMKKYLYKKVLTKKEYFISLIFISIIGFYLGILTIINIGLDSGIVSGSSMDDSIIDGTKTLYISEELKRIKRGDVITFYGYVDGKLVNIIKRVIALPGEKITINGANVYINGELLEEPYATYTYPSEDYLEEIIEENEYFVMGDNRSSSVDSRNVGPIPKKNILGVLIKSR